MTDSNDLRRLLDELSDQTPEVPAQEWLAGTRRKVRARRRTRWAGASGAAALVLAAAVAVVPQVVDTADPEPPPVAPEPDEDRQWEVIDGTNTHLIIASRLNDPGSSELQWTTEIPRGHPRRLASSVQFCHLPEDATSGQSRVRAVSSIDGRRVTSSPCRHWAGYPPVDGQMIDWSADAVPNLGVHNGESFTVLMWLERAGQRVKVSGAEFGFALYWCGSQAAPRSGTIPGMVCASLNLPWR